MKKLTKEIFIMKSKLIHDNKYDYSLSEYKNSKTKIKIICRQHGLFEQEPSSHLRGNGCSKCVGLRKLTTEEFIEKSLKIHKNKYDYSMVKYINSKTKVKIICKEHGIFEQEPHAHSCGNGCPNCPLPSPVSKLSIEILKERCYKLHKEEYSILSTEYINNSTKIMVKHNKCLTEYMVKPIHFSNGSCCPNCYNKSKGEKKIKLFLDENNIIYKTQYGFSGCKHKQKLNFDFYLPELNICIEYDGKQHFQPVEKFGGNKEFELTKIRDGIKNSYCENNNISLIRIPYTKLNKINETLREIIFY